MQLHDAGVVITGGGNGIGAAHGPAGSRRSVRGSSSTICTPDRATRSRARSAASPCRATRPLRPARRRSSPTARAHLGAIDLFCANAGVGTGGGPEAPEDDWDLAWQVNVMAHVRAARALLPDWLERGRGHFLATVSAAGLLTMLGSAPYSVTKHGALAFAEWMQITYADRGVTVQALCPQGVRTAMLEASGTAGKLLLGAESISPRAGRRRGGCRSGRWRVPDPAAPRGGRLLRRPGGRSGSVAGPDAQTSTNDLRRNGAGGRTAWNDRVDCRHPYRGTAR